MRKYLYLIKMEFGQIGAYRTDLIFTWIYRLFQMLVMFILWSITQKTESEIARLFSYYFIFFLFFDSLLAGKIARWMSKDIRSGSLNAHLLRPINYPFTLWAKQLAQVSARVIVPGVLFVIFYIARPDVFAAASFWHLVFFFITALLGIILSYLFTTITGLWSFWVLEIAQTNNVISLLLNLVTGKYIPLYLFSAEVQNIIGLTPANYWGNFQIQVYQGHVSGDELLKGILVMIVWSGIFLMVAKWLYARGVKVYEANGS